MTALEALRKIEHTKVEYDVYLPDMGLYDEDGNLYAVKVCAGFFGFDDEFEEVEQALKREEPVLVKAESYDKDVDAYRCPKCNGLINRYHAYCSDCGQKLDRTEVEKHERILVNEIKEKISKPVKENPKGE